MRPFNKVRLLLNGSAVLLIASAALSSNFLLVVFAFLLPMLSMVFALKQREVFRLAAAAYCAETDKNDVAIIAKLRGISWLPQSWVIAEAIAGWEYANASGFKPGVYDDFEKALGI